MIYLDHASTSPAVAAAFDRFLAVEREIWGNPSSLHAGGIAAKNILDEAKGALLSALLPPFEPAAGWDVVLTSGGTESCNLGISGVCERFRSGRIVVAAAEHSAVREPCAALKARGLDVVSVAYGGSEAAFLKNLAAALNDEVVFVAVMAVNNEAGVIFPLAEAAKMVRRQCPGAVFFCDASHAFCKLDFFVPEIDIYAVSGHKIGAFKGSGAVFARKGAKLSARILGGKQQEGLRAGTEPAGLAAAFAAAAGYVCDNREAFYQNALAFTSALEDGLGSAGLLASGRVVFNRPEGAGLSPYIISLSMPGLPSEVLMRFLEEQGVLTSAGSACSKGKTSSAAKDLIGVNASFAVRVSICGSNTVDEAGELAKALAAAAQRFEF